MLMQQESSTITNRMQFKTIHVKLRGVANAFPPPWLRYGSQSICHQWTLLSATLSFQVGKTLKIGKNIKGTIGGIKSTSPGFAPLAAFSLLSNSLTRHFISLPLYSPQAFWTWSFLDSAMSCDVTKRYSSALTQASRGQRIKRDRLGTRLVPGYYPRTNFARIWFGYHVVS